MSSAVFTPGRWFVAFYDGSKEGSGRDWWDLFTRPGFRHCFAFRYLEPMDAWVAVDWANEGLFIEFLPKRFVDGLIVGVNDAGGCFLEVDVKPRSRRLFPLSPLYCVSAIKDLVGLRSWRVITPYQLYCALMKRGANRMFDLSHIKENTDGEKSTESAET